MILASEPVRYTSSSIRLGQIEQQKIDVQEHAIKEAERKVILDRASKILEQSDDKVKAFRGALMMSDVIEV